MQLLAATPRFVIGRDPSQHWLIPDRTLAVSARHCEMVALLGGLMPTTSPEKPEIRLKPATNPPEYRLETGLKPFPEPAMSDFFSDSQPEAERSTRRTILAELSSADWLCRAPPLRRRRRGAGGGRYQPRAVFHRQRSSRSAPRRRAEKGETVAAR